MPRLSVLFVNWRIGRQMFPQAVVTPLCFVVETLAALALNQALTTAGIGNHHHS